ncbi:MAG: hypothetical protein IKK52_02640 [Alphaproteobacteria bacterium]|nr:hypothetical protein [Alphaproteobacteria bacterium]
MEIKAKLNKPYTSKQRADFIVANNHNKGYEIKEVADGLEAWGLTNEEQEQAVLENKQKSVRAVRNSYLQATDIYMLIDFPISAKEREEYKAYRRYLRDYTAQENWWEEEPKSFDEWKEVIGDDEQ